MSSLEPSCYTNYYKNAEVVSYFTRSVEIDRTLSPHAWLAEAGIVPSLTKVRSF
jgi:ribonuclease T2